MKILESDVPQGSSQWHQLRKLGIGGSEIASVMDENPYQTCYKLWQIKTGIIEPEDISGKFHVKRGHDLEPLARKMANAEMQATFEQCSFVHDRYDFMKYSSDGFDENKNEIIEIKALGDKNHEIVLSTNKPLPYYVAQCQWGLMISGAKVCHFISYNPSHPRPYKRIPIYNDQEYQNNLIAKAKVFWALVQTKTPPDITDADFEKVENTLLDEFVAKYKAANIKAKELEAEIETFKHEIKMLAGSKNLLTTTGAKVYTSFRKGAVEYTKIPALEGVDLEPYRKGPVAVFNIKG